MPLESAEDYEIAKQKIAEWESQDDSFLLLNLDSLRIKELPILPANLRRLNCSGSCICKLPSLPIDLTYLDCSACFNLKALPELPELLV